MEDQVFNLSQLSDDVFSTMVKRRYEEASGHWEKEYKLKSTRKENLQNYLTKYIEKELVDDRYQEIYSDNRQFVAARTILPFLTARVTAPQVTPANGDDDSMQFAIDFEKALQRHAEKQQAKAKIRLAIQDVLTGARVGYLKWRYDATLDTVKLEYVPADSCVIGRRSHLYEEPDYFRHTQKRTVADLIRQFPNKEKKILDLFGIKKGVPSQLQQEYDIDEDWIWADIDSEQTLLVGWSYQNTVFGKMSDPNWDEKGNNLVDTPMIPFTPFNFLNDGRGWIDQTSYIEQGKYLQRNYDKRGQVIAESAKYGGTGVPIFAKGSIPQADVAKIRFSPIQRVLLDTTDVSKSFTTWQAQTLPAYIFEDKKDSAMSIDNIWGVPDVLRGEQSGANTLGQDLLVRDNAEGRQADPLDCIDASMTRFYLLEAQLMYRYFTEEKFYNYIGNDGKFVSIIVSKGTIRKNLGIEIDVQAGTSLPIDRAQKRATVLDLLKANKISTLVAYKELGIFDDPEEAFKQFVKEQTMPAIVMDDMDKAIKSREAEQDLQAVIAGRDPVMRDDVTDDYLKHLNEYLLSNKFHMLKSKEQKQVQQFIQSIVAMAQVKLAKMGDQEDAMPPAKAKEVLNYRDAPPDIQAQMEQKQGYQPSTVHDPQMAAGVAHTGTNTTTVVEPQQPPMPPVPPGMPPMIPPGMMPPGMPPGQPPM